MRQYQELLLNGPNSRLIGPNIILSTAIAMHDYHSVANLMSSPFNLSILSPGKSPAREAAPPESTERIKTGQLPLRVSPKPPPPRFTRTTLTQEKQT